MKLGAFRFLNGSNNVKDLVDSKAKLEAMDKSLAMIEFSPDGTILLANDNFLNVMGYKLREIQGQHHSIFVPGAHASSEEYKGFWAKLNRGEFHAGEFHRLAKGGKDVWLNASYCPVFDPEGKLTKVVKFASDVTKQKLLNVEFEAQIKAIGRSQSVISFNPDGTILNANDNFLNAVGYPLQEIIGKHHRLFVAAEEQQSPEYKSFWQQLAQGQFLSGEFKRIAKDGREIWLQASYNPIFDFNGKVTKVVKYASDITQQKVVAADYSGQIDAISKSQAVITFDMNGNILDANENFLATMGYSLDEIIGKHHSMFAMPGVKESTEYKDFWAKLNRGEYESSEFKRMGKGGKEVWIQASYNPILDLSGKPFKVVKYASDITEQKLKSADYEGQIHAIGKSQAVISFQMDGTIIDANLNFLNTMGYTLGEVKGKHHSMFAEEALKHSPEYSDFWQRLNNGEFFSGEFKRVGKGGKEVWIQASYNPILDANGKPFKVVKYATDVTRQKLQSADYGGQVAAISKSQAVISFNLDGTILDANENFLHALGYRIEEIRGKHHRMFVEPGYRESAEYKKFWAKLNCGEFQAGEYKRISKSGNYVWIQASYNPILNADGKPFKVVKYATDVTGRVHAVNAAMISLEKLSQGDLSAMITDDFIPEFQALKQSINATFEKLQHIVSSITNAAAQVASGASQISQGNADLSRRTEQQASSLEETAASMEQMTANVKNNAENSRLASKYSVEANQKAEEGGNIVRAAVDSMNAISASSKKINDIIGVIDELAFQTNLLALNAAVEAARAGEHGRGFAVVASEVRSLAQRSATAAKEIKELIKDSVGKVESGTRLVHQSGETLVEIVEAMRQIADMIANINISSSEQASGIGEINQAVSQMDTMTQQNAALVEEATSASESLANQAGDMHEQLSFFKL
ncbi:methyl-accepting chemotaxis protein [Paraneptunicella aestuarii]|uniref:methyl-accepting chemotaxis protein n=1 Tax=Paraneptunicella aestuarii TaxID=2831148 RepID=UPI001E32C76C|nr:methyl-accepting chemotaxis protein [Paraneptunicella aestuarii]